MGERTTLGELEVGDSFTRNNSEGIWVVADPGDCWQHAANRIYIVRALSYPPVINYADEDETVFVISR